MANHKGDERMGHIGFVGIEWLSKIDRPDLSSPRGAKVDTWIAQLVSTSMSADDIKRVVEVGLRTIAVTEQENRGKTHDQDQPTA